jgi:hypothetical protein
MGLRTPQGHILWAPRAQQAEPCRNHNPSPAFPQGIFAGRLHFSFPFLAGNSNPIARLARRNLHVIMEKDWL